MTINIINFLQCIGHASLNLSCIILMNRTSTILMTRPSTLSIWGYRWCHLILSQWKGNRWGTGSRQPIEKILTRPFSTQVFIVFHMMKMKACLIIKLSQLSIIKVNRLGVLTKIKIKIYFQLLEVFLTIKFLFNLLTRTIHLKIRDHQIFQISPPTGHII